MERLVLCWGVGGVVLVLLRALSTLSPLAVEALRWDLQPVHWAFVVPWTLFMAWAEGWRGFHVKFAPRVVKRALHLSRHPSPRLVILAPLHAMALIHATRRRLIGMWTLVAVLVAVIVAVGQLPQPWRGLVDVGVVVGLTGGTLSILGYFAAALVGREPGIDPDLP